MTRRSTRRGAAASAGGGPGDITAVVAGSGLTGGATTGSATLAVDHATASPAAVGTAAVGTATKSAREDHVHAHGNQASNGSLHAEAVASGAAGFLSGTDKAKLDGIAASAAALGVTAGADVTLSAGTNGSGSTAAKVDHTHALSQAIAPTWTGLHTFSISDALTTTYAEVAKFKHDTSGTAAAGFGIVQTFQLESAAGNSRDVMKLGAYLRTATDAGENAGFVCQLMSSGAAVATQFFCTAGDLLATSGIGIGSLSAAGATTNAYRIGDSGTMYTYTSFSGSRGGHAFLGTANTSGARSFFTITPSANTGQTAGTAIKGFQYAGYTKQWASNTAVDAQSEFVVEAPTYAFASAGGTMTGVTATMDITGAPIAGANLSSFANAVALRARERAYFDKDLELVEMTAPAAPITNHVRLYAEDNGAGKTRLMALFPTGAAQQVAIEP